MSQADWDHLVKFYKDKIIDGTAIADIWQDEDVYHRANEFGINVDEQIAKVILKHIQNKHDANIGITWDVIDVYLTIHTQQLGQSNKHYEDLL